ncbi:pyrimidine operon attenuation protein/uracil phosphoribosyltransferase [Mucilaginibacter sp. OAE612]
MEWTILVESCFRIKAPYKRASNNANNNMPEKKLLILNKQQIQQKLDRMAYQILEDNFDENEILIAGILPRGNHIAERLKTILDGIAPFKSRLLTIELEKQSSSLSANIDFEVEECSNKVVILVDDVLNSGKTLAYGFGVFLDVPLKKLRTAVLVDRNHKSFPITTDFAGVALSTVIKEHVDVVLDEEDGEEDAVYLR